MALEASARAMTDIQNFIFWMTGGVVQLLQGLLPDDHPQRRLSASMCDILAMAMSHLSGEIASQTAFAVCRRREHYLSLLPQSLYSEDEFRALRASPLSGPLLFDDQRVREVVEQSSSRTQKDTFSSLLAQRAPKSKSSKTPQQSSAVPARSSAPAPAARPATGSRAAAPKRSASPRRGSSGSRKRPRKAGPAPSSSSQRGRGFRR